LGLLERIDRILERRELSRVESYKNHYTMPPKDPKKLTKKEKKKLKQLELLQQKMEEDKQKKRDEFFNYESQERNKILYEERLALAEVRLDKNRQFSQFLVERRSHNQLQQRFQDLSRAAASEKSVLDKAIVNMNRTKELLETELTELQVACKAQAEELTQERKKLEAEMSERGNCFVCADCAKTLAPMIRKQGLAAQLLRREGLL